MKKMILVLMIVCSLLAGNLIASTGIFSGTFSIMSPSETPGGLIVANPVGSEYLTTYGQRPMKKPVIAKDIEAFEFTEAGPAAGDTHWAGSTSLSALDTFNRLCGVAGVKITVRDDNINETLGSDDLGTKDWSCCHFYVRFYVHPGSGASDPTNISIIRCILFDGSGREKTFQIYQENSSGYARSGDGWHEANFTQESAFAVDAGFDTTDIVQVKFLVRTDAGVTFTPTVTFDELRVFPAPAKATVMVRLDDVYSDFYNLTAYANKKGIPVTWGLIKENIVDKAYLTLEQVQEFQDAGNLMVNHTTIGTNPSLHNKTDAEIRTTILEMQQWMCEVGFTRGAKIFILPEGKILNSQIPLMESLVDFLWYIEYTEAGATNYTGGGITTDYDRFYCTGYEGQYTGRTAVDMNDKLDQAVMAKAVYCPFWHGDNATPNFEDHMDYIAAVRDGTTIGAIASVATSDAGATSTFTTSAAHILITGDLATISGCSEASYNGEHTITKLSDTTFKISVAFVATDTGSVIYSGTPRLNVTTPDRYINFSDEQ